MSSWCNLNLKCKIRFILSIRSDLSCHSIYIIRSWPSINVTSGKLSIRILYRLLNNTAVDNTAFYIEYEAQRTKTATLHKLRTSRRKKDHLSISGQLTGCVSIRRLSGRPWQQCHVPLCTLHLRSSFCQHLFWHLYIFNTRPKLVTCTSVILKELIHLIDGFCWQSFKWKH